ncbi:hypothetical protein MmiAt1_17810 [Methanimicrococcus sp. At1]|uniref:Secreted peptide n=1 Tax=Methanimicrococcus hacksteinii TaxID=3028293 RepID=A0ABU3VRW5_9EURY|nr:hypothetical protein [Methanimicrococcus sp. At1]
MKTSITACVAAVYSAVSISICICFFLRHPFASRTGVLLPSVSVLLLPPPARAKPAVLNSFKTGTRVIESDYSCHFFIFYTILISHIIHALSCLFI